MRTRKRFGDNSQKTKVETKMGKILNFFKEWGYQAFVGFDNFCNAFFLIGSADESVSGRCFRLDHIKPYRIAEIILDTVFRFVFFQGPDHCKNAYIKDVRGRQLPKHFYDKAIAMGIQVDPSRLGSEIEMP